MTCDLPAPSPAPIRGGAETWPITFAPASSTALLPLPPAPPKLSVVESPVSQPRPADEIRRRPALSGLRAVVEESPGTFDGPDQTPWTLYASTIAAPTFGSWADDCTCPPGANP